MSVDGIAVMRQLRDDGIAAPVLIVSALGEVDDRVRGLRAGGDDYLVKPFSFVELVARVEALGRRSDTIVKETILRVADLALDQARLDPNFKPATPSDRVCRFSGALQRGAVDGGHRLEPGDALGGGLGFLATLLREMEPRRATGEDGARGRRPPKADEQDERGAAARPLVEDLGDERPDADQREDQ